LPHFQDGRALRIDDTYDIGVLRRIAHFDELTAKAQGDFKVAYLGRSSRNVRINCCHLA
jgi:hypothetical protein